MRWGTAEVNELGWWEIKEEEVKVGVRAVT